MRAVGLYVVALAAVYAADASADCEKLAQQFDWNARSVAYDTFNAAAGEKGWRLLLGSNKSLTIVNAMIAERCPVPDLDAERAYTAASYDCRSSGKPLSDACDMKKWVPTPPKS